MISEMRFLMVQIVPYCNLMVNYFFSLFSRYSFLDYPNYLS